MVQVVTDVAVTVVVVVAVVIVNVAARRKERSFYDLRIIKYKNLLNNKTIFNVNLCKIEIRTTKVDVGEKDSAKVGLHWRLV